MAMVVSELKFTVVDALAIVKMPKKAHQTTMAGTYTSFMEATSTDLPPHPLPHLLAPHSETTLSAHS